MQYPLNLHAALHARPALASLGHLISLWPGVYTKRIVVHYGSEELF